MRHRKTILKWSLARAKLAYQLLATSGETICRHSFGERYRLSLLMSFGAYLCYAALARLAMPDSSPLVGTFFVIYCALLGYHFIAISLKGYVCVHSYSTGMPWNVWHRCGLNNGVIRILIEPGFLFASGNIISLRDSALAGWFEAAAICLCFKEIVIAWNHRRHVLDAIDARLESEMMNDAIQQRTRPHARCAETQNPVNATPAEPQRPPTQAEMFGNVDPALRNLFGENERGATPPTQSQGPLGHLPRIVSRRRPQS